MNYLKGNDQKEYTKHSHRQYDWKANKGQRAYSELWIKGFHSVWDNNGVDIRYCKNDFERTVFTRGYDFAEYVLNK